LHEAEDQPQAGAEIDGHDGAGRHGTGTEYQPFPPAQGLSVPAQRRECNPPQSGMEYGNHNHPPGAGFVYLVAVIDWYSRKVLSWRLSNTLDNVFVERLWRSIKHEDVYLKGYATMSELLIGMTEYFVHYNTQRPHQALGYATPNHVYRPASGGGARILDKFSEKEKTHPAIETKKNRKPGRRRSAA